LLAEIYPRALYAIALSTGGAERRGRLAINKGNTCCRETAARDLLGADWVKRHGVSIADTSGARADENAFDAMTSAAAALRCVLEGTPLGYAKADPFEGGILALDSLDLELPERRFACKTKRAGSGTDGRARRPRGANRAPENGLTGASLPDAERQLDFLFKVQRILVEGTFEATYKFALLLSLADLAVERGNDDTAVLALDTTDIAEKFVELYWRQVLPWTAASGETFRLLQRFGREEAAILVKVKAAHERAAGSLARFRAQRPAWLALVRDVAGVIERMPLWKLQTIGRVKDEFLYPDVGKGRMIRLRGEAVYCLRRFYSLIADLVQTAWVRFVQRVPGNQVAFGQVRDLREFLFGSDRAALDRFARVLADFQNGRCFYCEGPLRTVEVDHFIAWSMYPLDLGHNFVVADKRCNAGKCERLPAIGHLERWAARNRSSELMAAFDHALLPHNREATNRVAEWAYESAARTRAMLWVRGKDVLEPLPRTWRAVLTR
jgi:hypothetical protein